MSTRAAQDGAVRSIRPRDPELDLPRFTDGYAPVGYGELEYCHYAVLRFDIPTLVRCRFASNRGLPQFVWLTNR